MKKKLLLFIVHLINLTAAITNVRITDIHHTDFTLRYLSPDNLPCRIKVSESITLTPLIHDINPSLYTDADLDSKYATLQRGRERVFVVGKRTIKRALSGVAYSLSLQTNTQHYIEIGCSTSYADTVTLTVLTSSPPLGDTHGDSHIPDPDYTGYSLSITPSFTRNSTWIDPHSGVLHKRIQQSQDNNIFRQFNDNLFSSVISSTNWVNPSNVLSITDSGASATYDGTNCSDATTCDWLILSLTYTPPTSTEDRIDVIRISANGSGDNATSTNRDLYVCPVVSSTSTIDTEGACRDLSLPQTTPSKILLSALGIQDTWRVTGKREWTYVQLATAGNIRFAIRKKTNVGVVTLDAIRIDIWLSTTGNVGTGGSYDRTSPVKRSDGTYLTASFNPSSANNLYKIHGETGESTFLGAIYSTGNFSISQDNFLWDATDPNVFYGQGSGDTQQFKYTYTGDGNEVAAGTKVTLTRVALTPGGEDIGPAIQTYVTANSASYPNLTFSSSSYNCALDSVVGTDYLSTLCRGQQDTYGWQAVYKISTNSIIAAMPSYAAPASRWCVFHTRQPAGTVPALLVDLTFAKDQYAGNQIYKSTLVGDITSGTTTITVTSSGCSDGTCTSWVEGEPTSPSLGDDFLQATKTGDVVVIDNEYIRIGNKISPTSWEIIRGLNGSTAASHSNGSQIRMFCANAPGAGPTSYIGTPFLVWNFLGDPTGLDATGTYVWPNLYTGHATSRLNVFIGNKSVAQSTEGTFLLNTVKDPPYNKNVPEAPWFALKQPPGQGNCYQQHPNFGHTSSSQWDRQFFYDIRPSVAGDCFSPQTPGCDPTLSPYPSPGGCAAARVSGLTNVYKVIVTGAGDNADGLNPKHLNIVGFSGNKYLRDVSGPSSVLDDSVGKDHSYCITVIANECVTGSSPGDAYVQIPSLAVFYCDGSNTTVDACLGDYMAFGVTAARFGFTNGTREGLQPNLISNINAVGPGYTQLLSRHGLNLFYNLVSLFTSIKPLPNNKWAVGTDWVETPQGRGLYTALKIPPAIKDSINRTSFIPVEVKIPPMRGVDNVLVQFGYQENGTEEQQYCTTRAEACIANSSTINLTTPFYFSSESYSGLSCSSGCTITIPAYPSRTIFYKIIARDSSNNVLMITKTQVTSSK